VVHLLSSGQNTHVATFASKLGNSEGWTDPSRCRGASLRRQLHILVHVPSFPARDTPCSFHSPLFLGFPSIRNCSFLIMRRGSLLLQVEKAEIKGGDQEDCGSRPVQEKSWRDPISTSKNWVWWCVTTIPAMWEA
jgi:hypothetical protein